MIIPLHAGNPGPMTGSGNWTYLITGVVPVLVDAGVGKADHVSAIEAHVPAGPAHVVVTHAHEDHVSGVDVLVKRWRYVRFWKFPWPERDTRHAVPWNQLADRQVVPAGDDELQVIHTPGHAPDHICLWHQATETLLCGDLLVAGSTVVIPPSAGGSLTQYLASLERVDALNPRRALPAHGPPIEDPPTLVREYIAHRYDRERQVLTALREGDRSPAAIAERIYVGLVPALELMARETVLAHLLKLEADGLVSRVGDHWEPRD